MPDLGARAGRPLGQPASRATGEAGARDEPAVLSLSFNPASSESEKPGACRVCGCTEWNACIDPGGAPCRRVEDGLCSQCSPESEVEVMLRGMSPQDPETQQALEALIQAAARVLLSQPARREARRAKPELRGFHETRDTRHESRPLRSSHAV